MGRAGSLVFRMDALKARLTSRSVGLAVALATALVANPAIATSPPVGAPTADLVREFPDGVVHAFQDGVFDLPPRATGLATSASRPVWRLPVILVSFSDDDTLRYG